MAKLHFSPLKKESLEARAQRLEQERLRRKERYAEAFRRAAQRVAIEEEVQDVDFSR